MFDVVYRDMNVAFLHEVAERGGRTDATPFAYGETVPCGVAIVSPANSIGYMDGGVDNVLRSMFPEVERDNLVRNAAITAHTLRSGAGYLPVGSASVFAYNGAVLISAPTMWIPQPVNDTNNAFWAARAAMCAATLWNELHAVDGAITTLTLCGMCTGYGSMPPAQAAEQMVRGVDDFDPTAHITDQQRIDFCDNYIYLCEPNLKEQPGGPQCRHFYD
jgi:O-acetyl-ADP-ribose deacetylase (regulator of RNase III)